ncbi:MULTISPECIES: hypothetical protein [unclassified Paenibacillus]|uniref:hypothetical protein n=1 Tax=unclassified Paenibacillus TaxID=185978 RepID=UPI0036395746
MVKWREVCQNKLMGNLTGVVKSRTSYGKVTEMEKAEQSAEPINVMKEDQAAERAGKERAWV